MGTCLFLHSIYRMKRILLFSLFTASLFCGCHRASLPEGVLNHDQMVDFLCEAYRLEAFYAVETRYNYDTLSPEWLRAYDDILQSQGITRAQVDTSLTYYARHPEPYSAIQQDVLARMGVTAS